MNSFVVTFASLFVFFSTGKKKISLKSIEHFVFFSLFDRNQRQRFDQRRNYRFNTRSFRSKRSRCTSQWIFSRLGRYSISNRL